MIEVKNLTKSYKAGGQIIKAVDNASIRIEKGEFISIVGHSGSGKTTLLSLMGGLTKPDNGTVVINGTDLWSISDDKLSEFRNRKINFIYQFSSLIPTLTSLENVMLPSAFGKWAGDADAKARELLSMVGLEDKTNSFPSQLSGGQQRRVAIARAFVNDPEVVLADEPTGDLDEETEAEIFQLFERFNREKELTLVLVTHSRELAGKTGRQVRMDHGVLKDA